MNFTNEFPPFFLANGKRKNFKVGSHIFKINQEVASCYFILFGVVKIYIDHDNGRRSILDFIGAGDWVGELSLFCQEVDIKENRVLKEIECLEFDLEELKALCKSDAGLSYYFASYVSSKLLSRSYRMSEGLNYSLEKRLAQFILKYQDNGKYDIPHTEVAEYLNVSYRHVLHVMKHFRDLGILKKSQGKGYDLVDSKKLETLPLTESTLNS